MGRGRRGGEEGVGKGVEDGGKHKEGGLVSDPPPQSATCAVGGPLPGPAGKDHGRCPGTVDGPCHPDPPPVGVGGNGWRCPNQNLPVPLHWPPGRKSALKTFCLRFASFSLPLIFQVANLLPIPHPAKVKNRIQIPYANLLDLHLPCLGCVSHPGNLSTSELLIHKDVQTIFLVTVIQGTWCSCMTKGWHEGQQVLCLVMRVNNCVCHSRYLVYL
jgi:hypothetical protein